MGTTSIEWTDETHNIARGCEAVSPGCLNCYAARLAVRFSGAGQSFAGLARMKPRPPDARGKKRASLPVWSGEVTLIPKALREALGWSHRHPKRVFVGSMTDIFHRDVPFTYLAAWFAVMAATPWVTYQLVTKRAARMLEFFEWLAHQSSGVVVLGMKEHGQPRPVFEHPLDTLVTCAGEHDLPITHERLRKAHGKPAPWPLPNVHLLVSTENQETYNERVPLLLRCPAVVHGISAEPLLGPIDMGQYVGPWVDAVERPGAPPVAIYRPGLRWVIIGLESGPEARPGDVEWIRGLLRGVERARQRGSLVEPFVKQLGACAFDERAGLAGARLKVSPDVADRVRRRLVDPSGGDESEWPEDLRGFRRFPVPATDPRVEPGQQALVL